MPWFVLGCALSVLAAIMVFQVLPSSVGEPLMYGAQTVTVVLACLAMFRRGRRSRGRLRRARLLVAASLLCGALGGVLAVLLPLLTGEPPPVPSVVDAVHFLFVPLVVAGLLSYPVVETESGSARGTCWTVWSPPPLCGSRRTPCCSVRRGSARGCRC